MPRDVVYDQIRDSIGCSVHLSWTPPNNVSTSDITHYLVKILGDVQNEILHEFEKNVTATSYSICDCISHSVIIQAVNRCGTYGQSSPRINLGRDYLPPPTIMTVCPTNMTTIPNILSTTRPGSSSVHPKGTCKIR